MKRLFSIAALVAALAVTSSAAFSAPALMPVDDPLAMSQTANFVTDLIVLDAAAPMLVAVDNTISPLCRGSNPEFAGFCAAVAENHSLASGPGSSCKFPKVVVYGDCVLPPE